MGLWPPGSYPAWQLRTNTLGQSRAFEARLGILNFQAGSACKIRLAAGLGPALRVFIALLHPHRGVEQSELFVVLICFFLF